MNSNVFSPASILASAMALPWGNFTSKNRRRPKSQSRVRSFTGLDQLEERKLFSVAAATQSVTAHTFGANLPAIGLTPLQISNYYQFGGISIAGHAANGAGQTIALVIWNDDPNIYTDLQAFDVKFNLPDPVFSRIDQNGIAAGSPGFNNFGTAGTDSATNPLSTDDEASLDVEWAHAMAPGAKIVLVEASTNSFSDLDTAIKTAYQKAGATVVSMSFGAPDRQDDSAFTNSNGVTFLAASGDSGGTSPAWPSSSPDVISVSGTMLSLDANNNIISNETTWNETYFDTKAGANKTVASGGGLSSLNAAPSYQTPAIVGAANGHRSSPDISMIAGAITSPSASGASGVDVYDSIKGGWLTEFGTSVSSPIAAGLIAITNEALAYDTAPGLPALNSAGVQDALSRIYSLPSSSFHDIATGNNYIGSGSSNSATAGYDRVTGLGSVVASQFVTNIVATTSAFHNSNYNYVNALYFSLLGRGIDPTGVAAWVTPLDLRQTNDSQVSAGILNSDEYYNKLISVDMFGIGISQSYLPTFEAQFRTPLRNGSITEIDVRAGLFSSTLYTNQFSSVSSFFNAFYTAEIGRAPDANTANYFVNAISTGAMSIASAVNTIEYANERVDRYTNYLYSTYLRRSATNTDLNNFRPVLQQHLESQALIVHTLVDSQEYFNIFGVAYVGL